MYSLPWVEVLCLAKQFGVIFNDHKEVLRLPAEAKEALPDELLGGLQQQETQLSDQLPSQHCCLVLGHSRSSSCPQAHPFQLTCPCWGRPLNRVMALGTGPAVKLHFPQNGLITVLNWRRFLSLTALSSSCSGTSAPHGCQVHHACCPEPRWHSSYPLAATCLTDPELSAQPAPPHKVLSKDR